MSASRWDPPSVKALLRLAASKLGQLQERKDSQATVIRHDISTLLHRREVGLARTKAQNLMSEDQVGDLLENLEMQLGILLEHFAEVDQGVVNSPVVVEAVSTLIYAAGVELRELQVVRELLIQRLGADFARSAISNRDNHVSPRVVHALNAPPPTASSLDMYLLQIAKTYNVPWMPEPRRQDMSVCLDAAGAIAETLPSLKTLSEILDPQISPVVDMARLRILCARGIPDHGPPWLRARLWRLFFNTLPVLKSTWPREASQQRDSYYELVRRVLKPFSELPQPTIPLAPLDNSLLNVSSQLSRIPSSLYGGLDEEPERAIPCPLDENAPEDIRISYANILDVRLKAIHDRDAGPATAIPEIRLEFNAPSPPQISISAPSTLSERRSAAPTITLTPHTAGGVHPKHLSALCRILYLHTTINPGHLSPHIPALLVPLYLVLNQEIELEDLAHAEADTFWLFEAMIGEFAELQDEDGGSVWMRKLGARLAWADRELFESLQVKGLDPSLPHYSYRWLAPLLTQTLPLSSVLVVWDALFSYPMRDRNNTPKLEYLLDICTAMLIRARAALFRLGKGGHRSPSLWAEESIHYAPPPSPLRAWEFGDAFMEGMTLLQQYPIEAAGGIDRLLQTASDLAYQRQEDARTTKTVNLSLGARLRTTVWRGFTNQMPSPDASESEDQHEDEDLSRTEDEDTADDSSVASGLGARLANTVWRGITNKSSMEPPPTPITPISPMIPPPSPIRSPWPSSKDSPPADSLPDGPVTSTLWNYAEKLKDSDAAATIAKVSTNWRAKALLGSWGARAPTSAQSTPPHSPPMQSSPEIGYARSLNDGRHASLPIMGATETYSPPVRPAFFRPPRDSFIGPSSPRPGSPPKSPPWSPQSEGGFMSRTRTLQESLVALTRAKTPEPPANLKSGPRPLLLNSSSLMATTPRHQSHQESISEGQLVDPQWQHVPRGKGHSMQRDSISQSSTSSLSPLDLNGRGWKATKADLNPDMNIPSRRVALNRRSISPMAPISRIRPTSGSSSGTSPDRTLLSPTVPSSYVSQNIAETDSDGTNRPEPAKDTPLLANKLGLSIQSEDTTDSERPVISPRLRSKRYGSRPANIRTEDIPKPRSQVERPSPQTLSVDWPEPADASVTTPKAATFEEASPLSPGRRKMSGDGPERKMSGGQRTRKVSTGTIRAAGRGNRDSAAEEGDDEGGYDELLSAYESEDGAH
ncbi:regulator of Vps4 activity in the MVB pathway-domain-containing protein [Mycena amicta]|nr:regulator of Vps4 activity in the MVB pathway-domain-containing protein [Mycena amicta]